MAGFSIRTWSSSFATGSASLSAESTMNLRIDVRRNFERTLVACAGLHDGVDTPAIALPHRTKSRLASKIPTVSMSVTHRPRPSFAERIAARQQLATELPRRWCNRISRYIPLQRDMALGHSLHIEAHRRYRTARLVNIKCDSSDLGKISSGHTYSTVNSPPCTTPSVWPATSKL